MERNKNEKKGYCTYCQIIGTNNAFYFSLHPSARSQVIGVFHSFILNSWKLLATQNISSDQIASLVGLFPSASFFLRICSFLFSFGWCWLGWMELN